MFFVCFFFFFTQKPAYEMRLSLVCSEMCIRDMSIIFDRMNINTFEVFEAAGTKWNFLKFQPGLVGGHCIGVDPYYMT